MLLKYLSIAAAGLAAATTAFLVPPELTETDADTAKALPFDVPKITQHQTYQLACPGCPLQLKNRQGKIRVKQGVDSHLELNLTIDHQPEADYLLLNDFRLYPHFNAHDRHRLTAAQTPDSQNRGDGGLRRPRPSKNCNTVSPRLGYTIRWQPMAKKDGLQLILIDFRVIEVAGTFVDGIPTVRIKLIKTDAGGLMIGGVAIEEPQAKPEGKQEVEKEKCTTLACKWRAVIADRLKNMRQHKCAKMMGMHNKGKGSHHGHHHHRPGTFRMHEHSWTQLFKKFASHILFPIFVGILAGVSASIIGMVVGTVIIGLWRVLVRGQPFFHQRRRHAGHTHHKAAQKEAAIAEEKSGLMEHQDAPPSYEEEDNINKPAEA